MLLKLLKQKKSRFLVAIGIEKSFDSVDHNFSIFTVEKYGFGQNLILWVKILLRAQESCVLLPAVQLENISHLGEELVMVTQFQLFYLF